MDLSRTSFDGKPWTVRTHSNCSKTTKRSPADATDSIPILTHCSTGNTLLQLTSSFWLQYESNARYTPVLEREERLGIKNTTAVRCSKVESPWVGSRSYHAAILWKCVPRSPWRKSDLEHTLAVLSQESLGVRTLRQPLPVHLYGP